VAEQTLVVRHKWESNTDGMFISADQPLAVDQWESNTGGILISAEQAFVICSKCSVEITKIHHISSQIMNKICRNFAEIMSQFFASANQFSIGKSNLKLHLRNLDIRLPSPQIPPPDYSVCYSTKV